LTIRVPKEIERRLSREARRQRRTRSEVARAILEAGLSGEAATDPRVEAHRQSELASASAVNDDVRQFITDAADLRGWK
jgi:predicted transcriptional regulator